MGFGRRSPKCRGSSGIQGHRRPRRVSGPALALRLRGSLPRRSAPPLTSLFLCVYVRLFTRLPRNPLLASLQPRRRETRTPKCRSEVGRVPGAFRKPSPLLPLFRGAAGAPAVTPPRRADGASEDPGGQISLSFDRSFPIRSGFPPPLPTALPHPRGSQGSPAGSGFAWLHPAPPARASPLLLSGSRSSLDFGRSFVEGGMGGQAQVLPRESSPLFQSPARGALVSLRRQFFAPSVRSALPSLALEANWYRNRSLSFSFFEFKC